MANFLYFVIFDCALALSAAGLAWLGAYMLAKDRPLANILRDGQLFLYSATLIAAATGDLVKAAASTLQAAGAPPPGQPMPPAAVPAMGWELGLYVGVLVLALVWCAVLYGIAYHNDVMFREGGETAPPTEAEREATSTGRLSYLSIATAACVTIYVIFLRATYNVW